MKSKLKTLSSNIKLLRSLKSISQDEMASTIHLARSTYSTYETGAKVPDLQTIDALSALYGINFEDLVNRDLSRGILNRIYFDRENTALADILNDYQSLSTASKNLVMERIDTLLEREEIFFSEYLNREGKK
ncbi:MAG TPA: helix-turn-helix transcriptional regulator [Candidatus Copromorpha excrementigallinarum]|uniref:Helix-turn-helix transcriptional regulator n=1 Tax=Candidatus Allocopromorpha excrementigallinarum TaxID=2840742 RepID=A0A9D1I264_9FIRM|nr:helix-turn-helix transcriptional regulator [Candidatus Copromorpha excrementigallinarum]